MKRKGLLIMLTIAISLYASGCDSPITPPGNQTGTFQLMYGGSVTQKGRSVQQTIDGGYIVAGSSNSIDSGIASYDGYDYYVIKLNSSGTVVWQNMYGGSKDDSAYSIQQTSDGGFIVAGRSISTDIKGVVNHGSYDVYVIKLDSSGTVVWQNMYGGSSQDEAYSVQQTGDGGYVLAGYSRSTDLSGVTDIGHCYVIKLDSSGSILWQHLYDGLGNSIQQTCDGGYIVAGSSGSTSINGVTNHGWDDYYVIKLDSSGTVVWQNMYGGSGNDIAFSIQQTSDGGYIVAGSSPSTDINGVANHWWAGNDVYVIKLDSSGTVVWQNMYGGSGSDGANSVRQTKDGGYIIAGYSDSTDTGVAGYDGLNVYLIKLDSGGAIEWQKLYGGSRTPIYLYFYNEFQQFIWFKYDLGNDYAYDIRQTGDGGYILVGYSNSEISGVAKNSYGPNNDVYVLKLDANGNL